MRIAVPYVVLCITLGSVTGCTSHPPAPPQPEKTALDELTVIGQWSPPADGLSCRILVDRNSVQETGTILGAFQIRNTTNSAHSLTVSSGTVSWKLGAASMMAAGASVEKPTTLQLPANETFTTQPALILVPPGHGTFALTAEIAAGTTRLMSPAVEIEVAPAAWGAEADGLKIRIAATWERIAVSQQPSLHLFAANLTSQTMTIHAPDWASAKIEHRSDLVIITCRTDDEAFATIAPHGVWVQPVGVPLLLAPGKYRVRLVIDSPELPAGNRPAWHGQITSNDAPLEVVAQ